MARTYSYSILTPINLRKDLVKYGGYLPELDVDIFEHLKVVDYGDAPICVGEMPKAPLSVCRTKWLTFWQQAHYRWYWEVLKSVPAMVWYLPWRNTAR